MDPFEILRLQFPITRQSIFLNHAAVSPLPLTCRARMEEYLEELTMHGPNRYKRTLAHNARVTRELGARLLGAPVEGVFFVRSTTQGIGVAATGIPFSSGENLVLVRHEFPANQRPWLPLARRGVEVRFVDQVAGRVLLDDLSAVIDSKTRAVSVSWVQFLSGYRLDLAALAELCREVDALLVVDAIQGLGAFPIDVEDLGVDFLSADAHKWLLGPEGVGLGYASKRALERIEPVLEGWLAVENPMLFFDLEQPLKSDAARYEEGALNNVGLYGLRGSLELLLELTPSALERRILALTDYLVEGLTRIGWRVHSPRLCEAEKSGIILTNRPDLNAEGLARQLAEAGIFISVREGGLRISPHGYNTFAELDHLLERLVAFED